MGVEMMDARDALWRILTPVEDFPADSSFREPGDVTEGKLVQVVAGQLHRL
ncbi:hypothetical protein ABZ953_20070 [Streptomyces sp. NPDC046465]|uniref:hypothetical protein n=1 Tax=Streptomyces sp. NPDC046465 TaxID=3155810 RepID=UPI0033CB2CCF